MVCAFCGRPIVVGEDSVEEQISRGERPANAGLLEGNHMHLYPVRENGKEICPGDPIALLRLQGRDVTSILGPVV